MTKTFKQFVMEQPHDRPINHEPLHDASNFLVSTWGNCALGDYAHEVLKQSRDSEGMYDLNDVAFSLIGNEEVYERLNESRFDTYGELQDYYKVWGF